MPHFRTQSIILLCALMAMATSSWSAEEDKEKPGKKPTVESKVTCAVLDFDAKVQGNAELGKQVAEALNALLSAEDGFSLVDRTQLGKVLEEQELSLTGVVDTEQAVKVGKLVGAKIMITGKVFPLGKKLMLTARMIGTETSLVDSVLVKGDLDAEIDELVVELATQVAERMKNADKLLPSAVAKKDPLPELIAQVKKIKDKPVFAVIIPERHLATGRAAVNIDPAVETEIILVLREAGFKVVDTRHDEMATWAKEQMKKDGGPWPDSLAGADIVVVGEGVSEYSTAVGKLVSCAARVEVRSINRKDRAILFNDRATTRAVDLSDHIAGKNALQKAGRAIAINLLQTYLDGNSKRK